MRKGVLIRLLGKGGNQGFTLIELLIVVLIVGILAAVATPLYLGYVKDAKLTEGKSIAGSVWTAAQANALAGCGTAVAISLAWPKAGLTAAGVTADSRWTVTSAGTLTVDCSTGAYTVSATPLFTVTGNAADVTPLVVTLAYTAGHTPPAVLQCSTTTPAAYVNC